MENQAPPLSLVPVMADCTVRCCYCQRPILWRECGADDAPPDYCDTCETLLLAAHEEGRQDGYRVGYRDGYRDALTPNDC